jgi:hypothetical protein
MRESTIVFKGRTVLDKPNPSTVSNSIGKKLLQGKGIVFNTKAGHRLTVDEREASLLDGAWFLSTDLEPKPKDADPKPAFVIEGSKFASAAQGACNMVFNEKGFEAHSDVYIVEAIGLITSSGKQWKRVTDQKYAVARFASGTYEFDGDYCKLNPDIWKDSNALNRLETIDWNLRMMIPRLQAYGKDMHESFMDTWTDAHRTSWCDDELIHKGGMEIPEGVEQYVVEALEAYVKSAIDYFINGKERLSGPAGLHDNHVLCPQVLAVLPEPCRELVGEAGLPLS